MAEEELAVEMKAQGLSENDLLHLQNAFLKLHALNLQSTNIKNQFEILRRDAQRVDQETELAKKLLSEVREGIATKYNVDLNKTTVDDAGNFIPLVPQRLPFPVNGGK